MYYSEIQFIEKHGTDIRKYLTVNLKIKELSFVVIRYYSVPSAVVWGLEAERLSDKTFYFQKASAATLMTNENTGFKPRLMITEETCEDVLFSYTETFSDKQREMLLKCCKASDFEPYRNKDMSISDKNAVGYRDERALEFCGFSDSPAPYIKIPMNIVYDDSCDMPTERLYKCIYNTFFLTNKEVRHWMCL